MEECKCEMSPDTTRLLNRKEVAKLLNCNLVTLWRYTSTNRIPYYRVGRKMFFDRGEILSAIRVK